MISLKSSGGQSRLRGVNKFMKNVKKTVIFVLFLAVFYAVVRKTYRFLFYHESAYFSSVHVQKPVILKQEARRSEVVLTYNYERLLRLVEQSKSLKKSFYEQFTGVRTKIKPIDIKATKALLSDLYREKVRLDKYMRELKAFYKGNVPLKKANTLIYHQKVVEQCAQDVAEILRKV